jgi:pSer/pThr/pTyr-binding forkhead associated (FHA) protein
VVVDMPGISRTHARILVQDDQATLEDLGSKNGTYLRESRLQGRLHFRTEAAFGWAVTFSFFEVHALRRLPRRKTADRASDYCSPSTR